MKNTQAGFTILELAMSLIVVSALVGPAVGLYHQYKVEQDYTQTQEHSVDISNELGKYSSKHGRYPCPASPVAKPGDLNYGLPTDCEELEKLADGACYMTGDATIGFKNTQVCKSKSDITGKSVYTGALPFKTLNVQEDDVYDEYGTKFTYAVTDTLTDIDTFRMTEGGIEVKNKDGLSMVNPPSTAHFVIISHGKNKYGGYTHGGVQSQSCNGSTIEKENCDGDATFAAGENRSDSDDTVNFFTAVYPSEWRQQEINDTDIHMKNINGIAVGAKTTDAMNNAGTDAVDIRESGPDTGVVKVSLDPKNGTADFGKIITNELCPEGSEKDDADCLDPLVLGGTLEYDSSKERYYKKTDGGGMSCYVPADGVNPEKDEYLIAIENSTPICADELYMACPEDSFIQAIEYKKDKDGNPITKNGLQIKCDKAPEPPCQAEEVTTFCGEKRDLDYTINGDHQSVYSGTCHMIQNYDKAYFQNAIDALPASDKVDANTLEGAIKTKIIDPINAADRTETSCGPDENFSQVRDSYVCNSGTWKHTQAHERKNYGQKWPSSIYTTGSSWPAENNYAGDDPDNNNNYHDCWCREDYRVRVLNSGCSGGNSGQVIRIEKHRCPQTSHNWSTILQVNNFCSCTPGEDEDDQSCNAFVDEVKGNPAGTTLGLTGWVKKTYDVNCVGGVQQKDTEPKSIDVSACHCAAKPLSTSTQKCPTNTTNSWTWSWTDSTGKTHTGTETGKTSISFQEWVCPSGNIGLGGGVGSVPKPGYWNPSEKYSGAVPACTCNSAAPPKKIAGKCPDGQEGELYYLAEWDCSLNGGLGAYEPESEWETVNNCNSCAWSSGGGQSSIEDFAYGETVGGPCACGTKTAQFCHDYSAGGKYKVWTSCQCTAQVK